jgi:HEPN domain-containing protein
MDAKRTLARNWLKKARRDFLSAKRLARGNDPYLDTAIYHCQQCAEKSIKDWLVYHDLRLLVTLASEIEPKFAEWFDVAEQVSPYATAYRYPGEIFEPTEEEFQQALKSAGKFYNFICNLLPIELSIA